jgi:hypothetical protein
LFCLQFDEGIQLHFAHTSLVAEISIDAGSLEISGKAFIPNTIIGGSRAADIENPGDF